MVALPFSSLSGQSRERSVEDREALLLLSAGENLSSKVLDSNSLLLGCRLRSKSHRSPEVKEVEASSRCFELRRGTCLSSNAIVGLIDLNLRSEFWRMDLP